MTVAPCGALEAHLFLGTQVSNALIYGPGAICIRLILKATALVHRATELLDAQDAKEQEDEHHETDGITQRG